MGKSAREIAGQGYAVHNELRLKLRDELEKHDIYVSEFLVSELPSLMRVMGLENNSAGDVRPSEGDLKVVRAVLERTLQRRGSAS